MRLEELGAIRRVFRNVDCGAGTMGNVMFIAIDPARVLEFTYPDQSDGLDPMTKIRHRYGEKTPDIYKDYPETTRRLSSDHPTNQPENLSCEKGDEGLAETSESFERA